MGRVGRLRGSFLLAVTKDKVHAFKYRGESQNFQVREGIAVFDRDALGLSVASPGVPVRVSAPVGVRVPDTPCATASR